MCGGTIAFGGFATPVEAAHAAWLAHRPFERAVPEDFDELWTRSTACPIYRTLGRPGVRSSMWSRRAPSGTSGSDEPTRVRTLADAKPARVPRSFRSSA